MAATLINQLINLFWTVLFFAPVMWFWIGHFQHRPFFIILTISFIPLFLPKPFLANLQISHRRRFYKKAGIRALQRITQDGSLAKKLQRATGGPVKRLGRKNLKTLESKIEVYERYHYLCFLLFLFSALYAFYLGETTAGLLMLLANAAYNILPVMIQQYNNIRAGMMKRN